MWPFWGISANSAEPAAAAAAAGHLPVPPAAASLWPTAVQSCAALWGSWACRIGQHLSSSRESSSSDRGGSQWQYIAVTMLRNRHWLSGLHDVRNEHCRLHCCMLHSTQQKKRCCHSQYVPQDYHCWGNSVTCTASAPPG